MGYEIIKPAVHSVANAPFIGVSKKEITMNTAFVKERGWRHDKKYYAVLMRDTDTNRLCIDFKDEPFPAAFSVRWRKPSTRRGVSPYCTLCIPKGIALAPGRYGYKFDGRVCKTEIEVKKA